MHPGSSPLWNLALAIAELIDSEAAGNMPLASVRPIRRLLNRGRDALRLLQARHGLGEEGNVCLLLDQFEELFRYAREFPREEAEILIEILLGFEKDLPQGIHAVVTMRSDHLGECGHYEGFAELVNSTQYLLPRMDNKSLLRAIREPAALFGGDVSIDLGMRLVEHSRNDVDALPLVQHCLMRMWEVTSDEPGESGTQNLTYVVDGEREPTTGPTKFLQAQDYPGLRQLISNHADEILDELTQAGGENLRATEYLFRALTEVDTDGRGIRRPQRFADLVAVTGADRSTLTEIVDRFRRPDCGFLIPSTGLALSDDTVIDIGHEALIRCWTRLDDKAVDSSSGKPVGWLPREQEDGRVWRALLVSAESYREIGYWRRLTLSSRPDVLLKSVIPPIAFERLDWFQELPSPR